MRCSMIAVSYTHLDVYKRQPYLVAAVGFLAGGGFLMLVDHLLPHMHSGLGKGGEIHGPKSNLRRSILLVLAITIHNIPEGLAVGVAFGAAAAGIEEMCIRDRISS